MREGGSHAKGSSQTFVNQEVSEPPQVYMTPHLMRFSHAASASLTLTPPRPSIDKWDILAVSCYGPLDGGIPRPRPDAEEEGGQGEAFARAVKESGGDGVTVHNGLSLLEGGARLGYMLLGIIKAILFEVRQSIMHA